VEAGRLKVALTAPKAYGLAGQLICFAGQPPMKHFFYVYVLVSDVNETAHYTGVTQSLRERLRDHNRGACRHTAKHRPWRLVTAIAFESEIKARAFERYLKSGSGREFARRHF
jgi:predicted GIY-YIG superfamily endonuclease